MAGREVRNRMKNAIHELDANRHTKREEKEREVVSGHWPARCDAHTGIRSAGRSGIISTGQTCFFLPASWGHSPIVPAWPPFTGWFTRWWLGGAACTAQSKVHSEAQNRVRPGISAVHHRLPVPHRDSALIPFLIQFLIQFLILVQIAFCQYW